MNWLGLIGGTDVRDCTWRILKRVIANSLARNLNWRGVNGKTSLATLQLRDVVISKYIRLEILLLSRMFYVVNDYDVITI